MTNAYEQSNIYFFETETYTQLYNPPPKDFKLSRQEISLGLAISGIGFSGSSALLMISLESLSLLSGGLMIQSVALTVIFAAIFMYFAYKAVNALGESIYNIFNEHRPNTAPMIHV